MTRNKEEKLDRYSYLGAIHIHSKFSDGTGDVQKISKAARKAGLDWIIITDHNNFDIEEGIYNGVCVIKGEELSLGDDNHYLALGINEYIEPSFDAKENVEKVRAFGGFGFAAHPDEGINMAGKSRQNKWRAINWLDKNIFPDGVEIWNWFSQWGDNFSDKNVFSLIYSFLFRHKLINKPSLTTLKWWDDLNNRMEKVVPAIGGVDAHAMRIYRYVIPVTIFPYEEMFKTITNVITINEPLAGDFEMKKHQILNAIKNGQLIVFNRNVAKVAPSVEVNNSTKVATVGEAIKLDSQTVLEVKIKDKSLVKIFHNGIEIKNEITKRLELLIKEVGKYRVEILQNNKGFAYSNPIIVY